MVQVDSGCAPKTEPCETQSAPLCINALPTWLNVAQNTNAAQPHSQGKDLYVECHQCVPGLLACAQTNEQARITALSPSVWAGMVIPSVLVTLTVFEGFSGPRVMLFEWFRDRQFLNDSGGSTPGFPHRRVQAHY